MKNIQSQKGFTLAEMLVVVFIVALLSSVAVIGLGGVRSQGRDTKRISDLRQVQNALELYHSRQEAYPAVTVIQLTDWTTLGTTLGFSLPEDPLGDTYYYTSDGDNYTLAARLERPMSPALEAASVQNPKLKFPLDNPNCAADDKQTYCVEL